MVSKIERWIRTASYAMLGTVMFTAIEMSTAMAQEKTAASAAAGIRATLLQSGGWTLNWGNGGESGASDVVFEARGDKLVAHIQSRLNSPTLLPACEREVTIASDAVKFNGCYDTDINLRFDPSDETYPFKGTSLYFSDYKLQRK
jgi:hypothetical protein